jgi:hypothetical protein
MDVNSMTQWPGTKSPGRAYPPAALKARHAQLYSKRSEESAGIQVRDRPDRVMAAGGRITTISDDVFTHATLLANRRQNARRAVLVLEFFQFHPGQVFKLITDLVELSQYRIQQFISDGQLANLAHRSIASLIKPAQRSSI